MKLEICKAEILGNRGDLKATENPNVFVSSDSVIILDSLDNVVVITTRENSP